MQKKYLGIEFGTTNIKAVIIDEEANVLASGSHGWESKCIDGIWTVDLKEVWSGLASAYRDLIKTYGTTISTFDGIGVSAMMHGFLAFDAQGNQLDTYRIWRNTCTAEAADKLTELFEFNIPQRWSISHLYQFILELPTTVPQKTDFVKNIDYQCTLSAYVHYKLSGERVVGINDASGMLPIDVNTKTYDTDMVEKFKAVSHIDVNDIFPRVLVAGENAGYLTEEGARLIDPTGVLQAGAPMCPPEGDAGTCMVSTNALRQRTCSVSAGTSAFSLLVLDKPITRVHRDIDFMATPAGDLVANCAADNCTVEINAWVNLFNEFCKISGIKISKSNLFELLFNESLNGSSDCGGLLSYGFHSGEHALGLQEGRPLFVRRTQDQFSLANFMKMHIYASFATMRVGLEKLFNEEHANVDKIIAQGGLFTTPGVAQKYLAAALGKPVEVMTTASEGGPWAMALLASFLGKDMPLEDYCDKIFSKVDVVKIEPTQDDIEGYNKYFEKYKACLPVEKLTTEIL